ncbi:hypothetical protein CEXT_120151 [Caerostris extrusa]|uniref:Ycf15 n=1 Tax=Caerostris extrusa TaxID=172846 RepID=A0AAV4YFJ4_CAEEX|nr:hypothetical protein CEXT_120151 [Caerostris extrusa]
MPEQTRLESRITMKGFSPDSRRGGGQGGVVFVMIVVQVHFFPPHDLSESAGSTRFSVMGLANCSKYSVDRRPGSLLPDSIKAFPLSKV